jgi:hypothetical protein
MALSYALHLIESQNLAEITVFGEFLERYPPVVEVEIRENTSWSCSHGVERWRNNCGCRTYHACLVSDREKCIIPQVSQENDIAPQSWTQEWRAPLREAMNWLSGRLNELYLREAARIFPDPGRARDEYIDVILDRSDESIEWFFSRNCGEDLSPELKVKGLKLLEIQRNALLMFTSCGWFFDEISGIETVQVMMYASRAMQLAREVTETDLEPEYIRMLSAARSNIAKSGTGADIYTTYVKTAMVDISQIAFYYAITSLIEPYPEEAGITIYTVRSHVHKQGEAGFLKLVTGQAFFRSEITRKESTQVYAAIHIGDHNFMGGVGQYQNEDRFREMQDEIWGAFARSDIPELILCLNRHFESHSYSLWDLPRDGRRKVLYSVLETTLADIESEYRQIYCRYFALIRAMKEMQIKPPEALEYPIQYILNHDIDHNLTSPRVDLSRLETTVGELIHGRYQPDLQTLNYIAGECISWSLQKIALDPEEISGIRDLNRIFSLIQPLKLKPELWDSQNQYFRIHTAYSAQMHGQAQAGDEEAKEWVAEFTTLGVNLGVVAP